MKMSRVEGNDRGEIRLFTLSTCIWCKKTKTFLKDMSVAYDYVDIDLLEGDDREKALEELKQFNPRCSFPSLVINKSSCIVGYHEDKMKEALQL